MVVGFKNYLHNQCISPLKLWVWLPLIARCTQYNIMYPASGLWLSRSTTFPPPIKLTPLYNWTISLCGVQQHDPNLNPTIISISALSYVHSISLNGEVWAHINLFNSTAFYLSSCTKSVKWVVIQLCVGVSMLPRSTILVFDFKVVSTVWYMFYFILFPIYFGQSHSVVFPSSIYSF